MNVKSKRETLKTATSSKPIAGNVAKKTVHRDLFQVKRIVDLRGDAKSVMGTSDRRGKIVVVLGNYYRRTGDAKITRHGLMAKNTASRHIMFLQSLRTRACQGPSLLSQRLLIVKFEPTSSVHVTPLKCI
jgi:hypothetical protein